ncbi:MAG: response regulator transcription factor [Gammaproteobacteria bacterium]|jgi:two-component system response regulator CpxR|nr:response regulator transcription factor [Gammaproteobacteria bacterium]
MTITSARLLIVDDDLDLAQMLVEFLELQGFSVATAGSGETALEALGKSLPDLVILDVMLPGMDGFAVLQHIRGRYDLPVIMLTARGEEAERIRGLQVGADDYLAKPFNPLELAARVQNVLRRSLPNQGQPEVVQVGALQMNLARREFRVGEQDVQLTAAEMRVLEQLMRHPGDVISRDKLTEKALKRPMEAYDRSIDTLISKLRRKLEDAGVAGECIRSLRGHGYVLDPETLGSA